MVILERGVAVEVRAETDLLLVLLFPTSPCELKARVVLLCKAQCNPPRT